MLQLLTLKLLLY